MLDLRRSGLGKGDPKPYERETAGKGTDRQTRGKWRSVATFCLSVCPSACRGQADRQTRRCADAWPCRCVRLSVCLGASDAPGVSNGGRRPVSLSAPLPAVVAVEERRSELRSAVRSDHDDSVVVPASLRRNQRDRGSHAEAPCSQSLNPWLGCEPESPTTGRWWRCSGPRTINAHPGSGSPLIALQMADRTGKHASAQCEVASLAAFTPELGH
jgi:hypothetical protein